MCGSFVRVHDRTWSTSGKRKEKTKKWNEDFAPYLISPLYAILYIFFAYRSFTMFWLLLLKLATFFFTKSIFFLIIKKLFFSNPQYLNSHFFILYILSYPSSLCFFSWIRWKAASRIQSLSGVWSRNINRRRRKKVWILGLHCFFFSLRYIIGRSVALCCSVFFSIHNNSSFPCGWAWNAATLSTLSKKKEREKKY